MADESFANEVYNMYAKLAIGHGYYKTHNKFVPILTDGLEASRLEFRQMPFSEFDDTKYQDGI